MGRDFVSGMGLGGGGRGGGGISGNSWWGVPCLVLRFLTLFETNTSNANVREYLPGWLSKNEL